MDQQKVKNLVKTREELEDQKAAIGDAIKAHTVEVKAAGIKPVAFNALIRRRKMDAADREELDDQLETLEGLSL